MDEQKTQNSNSLIGIIGIIVIVGVALGLYAFVTKPQSTSEIAATVTKAPEKQQTQTASSNSSYKDGTYSAEGNYVTPDGPEVIGVSVTIKNDIVIDTSLNRHPKHPESVEFEGMFADGYKPLVVGKNIEQIKLDKVSGSSLTGKGFNSALDQIKAQAKV
jgi:uncharacterized protein with FMN-binding domain